jgi:hypothetical protein
VGPCQDYGRRPIEQVPQIGVATSRDAAVIVDLAGLIALGGEAEPGAY